MPVSPSDRNDSVRHRGWRFAGGLALVLGLAFWGYTTPDMQIHWETRPRSAVSR